MTMLDKAIEDAEGSALAGSSRHPPALPVQGLPATSSPSPGGKSSW